MSTQGLKAADPSPAYWASLSVEAALTALGTNTDGLVETEAALRLASFGPNTLPHAPTRAWYLEFIANFVHLFALLLWAGAGLAWIAGMPQLFWAIIAVILINGVFSYWQEYEAERAAEALRALLPLKVMIRRAGQQQLIPMSDVVPGDILVLVEGTSIPADARILKAEQLRVDTSSLTGESRPVRRIAEPVRDTDRIAATIPNLAFAGTFVTSGRGLAAVFATGPRTEFGRIAAMTEQQAERPSPLQKELKRVTRLVTLLAIAMGVLCFVVGTTLGGLTTIAGFIFAIGIIVANVPEGLLPTLTLSLALGVRRMARRNALVKRLSSVEALGATTIILTDKTGTLTENEMTLREVWTGETSFKVSGVGYEPVGTIEPESKNGSGGTTGFVELLRAAALCCDAQLVPPRDERNRWGAIGDPTEAAILVAAAKAGLSQEALAEWPRLAELPFDSTRKRMTTIQRIEGTAVACIKGAPSELFPRCSKILWNGDVVPFGDRQRQAAEASHNAMASRSLRVLAVAIRDVNSELENDNSWRADDVERELTLLGLLAMEDPPRPEVTDAVAACRRAGIRVRMVTGDDGTTATAIGREIGLYNDQVHVITGAKLDTLSDDELALRLGTPDVLFARVSPEHKLRLVEACQRRGEVVAVTGDGVNDAPALKRADIGVAMGATGTDVAREAADMVLADDNFASIVAAIEEGRAVYDNVRKFITYIFASNIPEVVPFIAFVLFQIPLPLTVMQILAVDLGTDLLPALALGMERPESDVMSRSPRSRSERLLNLPTLLHAYGWLGLIEAALSMLAYFFTYHRAGLHSGATLSSTSSIYMTATTMTFAGIVACQIGNAFACRSDRQSIFQMGFASNRMLMACVAVEIALLVALIYVPPLQSAFGLAPLDSMHWLLLATFPLLLLTMEETRKALRHFMRKVPAVC